MLRVAVIVVTYNAERFVRDCFESLARMRKDGLEVEIIVVDNASNDDTRRMLAMYDVRVIAVGANLGFAGGNNVGIRTALEKGVDYVFLLNHDTIVEPDFLVEAVRVAESSPRAGAVQSLLLLHPDTDFVNSTGNEIQFLGLGYAGGYRTSAEVARKSAVREITYPSGAAVLVRAVALEQAGLFDESYFMYHEDLDLGWRLRLIGWGIVLAPTSVVFHKYSFSRSIAKYFYMERNRWATLFKNCRAWTLVVLAPWLLLSEIGLFLFAVRGGWVKEKIRVYRTLCTRAFWKKVGEERECVQGIRTVSDRAVFAHFTPVISFQDVDSAFTTYVVNPCMTVLWGVIRWLIV